jgi:lipoprotein-anchoring transpeptidase ErfK/SrfK
MIGGMRQKSFILVAAAVLLLVGGAVAVYAYDSSRDDLIAEGVTVAGVDVGGMKPAEARAIVRREVAAPLERPIKVTHRDKRFTLSHRDAGLRADVGGMVDEALSESRDGTIVSRVARDVTGGEEDAQVPARISYSRRAVAGLVARVKKSVDLPAQDAKLNFPSLTRVKERNGYVVKTALLQRRVEQALTVPEVRATVTVPTRVTRPNVTRDELAGRYPKLIVVERGAFKLTYYERLRPVSSHRIAVGQVGLETPAGLYHVQNKAVNPAWSVPNSAWAGSLAGTVVPGGTPQNPLKARWLGIFDGAGIHGTDQVGSLGTAASHGCIRMAIPEVIELYDRVPVGAPVYIA